MRGLGGKKKIKRKKETGALEWLAQRDNDNIKAFLKHDGMVNIRQKWPAIRLYK